MAISILCVPRTAAMAVRGLGSRPSRSAALVLDFYLYACGFGGKGIRTPGLLIANETLYQLSYTPAKRNPNV